MSHGRSPHLESYRVNRRRLVQAAGVAALASGTALPARAQEATPVASPAPMATPDAVISGIRTYPTHGTVTASPATEISFRGASAQRLGHVRVSGSESSGHSGVMMPHQDGLGVSYVPDRPFGAGEEITVTADIPLTDEGTGDLVFGISVPRLPSSPPADREEDNPVVAPHEFRSRPDLKPPVIDVLVDTEQAAPGLVFLAPRMEGGQSGSLIIDNTGEPVWFYTPEPDLSESMDFRVNQYNGQPVLTWWEGAKPIGYGVGHYIIANAAYEQLAAVQVGNGLQGGDHHEFQITPRDTALFGIYAPIEWDLTPYGGAANAVVLDQVVQEVEIDTGRVLFEWHSLDHIDIDESNQDVPEDPDSLYDYVHMNSIDENAEGDLILSCRHLDAIVMIDRATSEVGWRLNGNRSDFEMGEGAEFAFQHDARWQPGDVVTLLDNGTAGAGSGVVSRGLALQLDYDAMTATVAAEYLHPTEGTAHNQANMQVLPNGNMLLGWGPTPDTSEVTSEGQIAWHAQFPEGGQSYRAYRFEWNGTPAVLPDIHIAQESANRATVYVSWNGATGVAEWRLVAGSGDDDLQPVTTVPKDGFETAIEADVSQPAVAVEAIDASGNVMARSRVLLAPWT